MRLTPLGRALEVFSALALVFSGLSVGGTLDYQAAVGDYESGVPVIVWLTMALSAGTLWFLQVLKRN